MLKRKWGTGTATGTGTGTMAGTFDETSDESTDSGSSSALALIRKVFDRVYLYAEFVWGGTSGTNIEMNDAWGCTWQYPLQ